MYYLISFWYKESAEATFIPGNHLTKASVTNWLVRMHARIGSTYVFFKSTIITQDEFNRLRDVAHITVV